MSFFSRLFGHKPKNQTELPEIKENDFLDNSDPSTNNLVVAQEWNVAVDAGVGFNYLSSNL